MNLNLLNKMTTLCKTEIVIFMLMYSDKIYGGSRLYLVSSVPFWQN